MTKLVKTGLVLSGLILFGAGCASQDQKTSPSSSGAALPEQVSNVAPASSSPEAVIEYKDGVFDPSTLRVLTGTKVTFVNKGIKPVWPASGVHPTHEICPGFDALKALEAGQSYSYTFERSAECPFHNHVAPGEKGRLEVKEVE